MKIGIIGAGRVGTTLGKYLSLAGIQVTGFYSRTRKSADEAATFAGTAGFSALTELVEASDTIFITTPDEAIGGVWKELARCDIRRRIICHFSGSLSSHVFSGIGETGAAGISIHPMYAFSDRFLSYQNFQTAVLTMEGENRAVEIMRPFWEGLGHRVLTFAHQENIVQDKIKYHAAAAMASNYMIGLFQASLNLLSDCGFSEQESVGLLEPLVRGNVEAMLERGCPEALTGPLERADVQTVKKHLDVLCGSTAGEIYRSMGETMLALAQNKNPDRDYGEVRKLFEAAGKTRDQSTSQKGI